MSLKASLLAIVCALGVAAPALADTDTVNGTVFTSSPISVKVGQDFIVALPGNPTTGYSWTAKPSSPTIISEGSAYERTPSAKPMMGAGGQQFFVFEVSKAGTGTITFSYARPWQKGVKPARTMTFNVTVK